MGQLRTLCAFFVVGLFHHYKTTCVASEAFYGNIQKIKKIDVNLTWTLALVREDLKSLWVSSEIQRFEVVWQLFFVNLIGCCSGGCSYVFIRRL